MRNEKFKEFFSTEQFKIYGNFFKSFLACVILWRLPRARMMLNFLTSFDASSAVSQQGFLDSGMLINFSRAMHSIHFVFIITFLRFLSSVEWIYSQHEVSRCLQGAFVPDTPHT